MGARKELAEVLQAALPDMQVVDVPRTVDRAEKPIVQVMRKTVQKAPAAPRGKLLTELEVLVIAPFQDVEGGEDALDDATDQVLVLLEQAQWLAWEKAERVTYNEMYPAYRIPVSAFTNVESD